MVSNFKQYIASKWKYISIGIKILSTLIGIFGTVFGVIKGYEAYVRNKIERERIESYRWQKVDQLIRNDSLRVTQWNELINLTKDLGIKVDRSITVQSNLKTYMVEKAATKEDLQKVYEVFDAEKKNSSNETRWPGR